jgi:hypothetical protein
MESRLDICCWMEEVRGVQGTMHSSWQGVLHSASCSSSLIGSFAKQAMAGRQATLPNSLP